MTAVKKGIALMLVVVILFVLTACANERTAGTGSTASFAVSNPVTLRFSWWGGDTRNQATLKVIKQFEEKNPQVKIEAEYGSSDGYNVKLATELNAGTAPDIVQIDPSYLPTYYRTNKNSFVDFQKQNIDLSGYEQDYLQSNGNYDGRQLGLPTGIGGVSIIENTDLASKIGIDLTQQYTWDDLAAMGKKVQGYDKNLYLLAANLSYIADDLLRPYLLQLTGKPLLLDRTKQLGVTQADLEKGLTMVKRLYDTHVLPPESHMLSYEGDNIPKDPNWISGKYVSALCVTSTAKDLAAANKGAVFVASKLPQMNGSLDEGYCASAPQLLCINTKSRNIPEAVKFLNYFLNSAQATEILGAERSIPAVRSMRQLVEEKKLADSLTMNAVNICMSYKGSLVIGYSSTEEVKSILSDAISYVAYGISTPAVAAENAYLLLKNCIATQK